MSETNQVEAISNQLENVKIEDPREKLKFWLGKLLKIVITDGRIIVGVFVCTDRDANIVLEQSWEYFETDEDNIENEPRMLSLAMIPGKHIKSICGMVCQYY